MKRLPAQIFVVLLASWITVSNADIIYVDVDDIPIFGVSTPAVVNFDFNNDASVDLVFESRPALAGFSVDPQGSNRAVINGNQRLAPLSAGMSISSSVELGYDWSSSDTVSISACASFPNGGVCVGEFPPPIVSGDPPEIIEQPAFVGVEFDIGGNTHYGWIRMSGFGGGGTIFDYAYESTPGQGIIAGAIPEPSTLILLLVGAIAISIRERGNHGFR